MCGRPTVLKPGDGGLDRTGQLAIAPGFGGDPLLVRFKCRYDVEIGMVKKVDDFDKRDAELAIEKNLLEP